MATESAPLAATEETRRSAKLSSAVGQWRGEVSGCPSWPCAWWWPQLLRIGGCGGGSLKHLRRRPNAWWPGFYHGPASTMSNLYHAQPYHAQPYYAQPYYAQPLPWGFRAAKSRRARPGEAQEPSLGAAKGGT